MLCNAASPFVLSQARFKGHTTVRILGLDPSLRAYGWALHDTDAVGEKRCIARGLFSFFVVMIFIDRYVFARESLRSLVRDLKPDAVGVESPPFGESFSEGMFGLFLYTNEALRAEKYDVVYLSAGQVKAHARESLKRPDGWKMMKPDMVVAAKADTLTKKSWDHNEADAYLVGRLAGRFWGFYRGDLKLEDLTPVESKQFATVHTYVRGKNAGKTVYKGLMYREEDRFFCWSTV